MTLIRGGPAGPDGLGGVYANTVESDRAALWSSLGGKQGVIRGFVYSGVAGQMSLSFTAGAALVDERDASGNAGTTMRGYHVWSDTATTVQFNVASPSARNDAVVAAFVDTEDGPVGTGGLTVGPQLVAVPGVSGTSTPRTDAQITAYLGRGGWVRLADVPIASTDTQINVAGIVDAGAYLTPSWKSLTAVAATGFAVTGLKYRKGTDGVIRWDGAVTNNTGADITVASSGNVTDKTIAGAGTVPAGLVPLNAALNYMEAMFPGVATFWWRVNADGSLSLTHGLPTAVWPNGSTIRLQGSSLPDYGA